MTTGRTPAGDFPYAGLLSSPPFGEASRQLARELAERSASPETDLAPFYAGWLLHQAGQGAVCIDLASPPPWPADWKETPDSPTPSEWETLADAPSGLVGRGKDYRPLIVENGRLYLRRYREQETRLARALAGLSAVTEPGPETLDLLKAIFSRNDALRPDLQRLAVYGALRRRFAVITGGPGTGKTTCLVGLLLALLSENPSLSAALAAPTGKAAGRIKNAITENLERLRKDDPALCGRIGEKTLSRVPREAATLHGMLGISPRAPGGNRHIPRHLSSFDIVVVDEASMIDLPMMTLLVENLSPHARLILLGDGDQLASVDVGSVLGDIVRAGEAVPPSPEFLAGAMRLNPETGEASPAAPAPERVVRSPLTDAVRRLTRTYRFKETEVIGRFCLALQQRRPVAEAVAALKDFDALRPAPQPDGAGSFAAIIAAGIREHHTPEAAGSPAEALAALDRFRFLCARRTGPCGAVEANRIAVGILKKRPGEIFHGLPLIVTVNRPELNLRNGDCGVFFHDDAAGHVAAWFPGEKENTPPRKLPAAKLPDWEPAFAMTIHKSQGSEFDAVALLLPPEDSPLLTRELVYTGASRAKKNLVVHADETSLIKALSREVTRPSGLAERLA